MARPKKTGLDYFPFDVTFFNDTKIRRLKAKYGTKGICVYISILCRIYGDKGYYAICDDDFILDISEDLGIVDTATRQIINYLIAKSLLCCVDSHEHTHEDGSSPVTVLTAKSVQRRYREAKRASKSKFSPRSELWIVENDVESGVENIVEKKSKAETSEKVNPNYGFSENNYGFSENNYGFSENNSLKESKVKESKVKESKVKESKAELPTAVSSPTPTQTTRQKLKITDSAYQHLCGLYPASIVNDYIERVYAYCAEKGKRYSDYALTVKKWIDEDAAKGKISTAKSSYDADEYLRLATEIDPSLL